jgi:predicted Zn finger-like uncharacterized protein
VTLATKCPACATVFRVVQDQLRVSDGWVRCGRCAEVFNAATTLVEVPAPVHDDGPDTEVQYDAPMHAQADASLLQPAAAQANPDFEHHARHGEPLSEPKLESAASAGDPPVVITIDNADPQHTDPLTAATPAAEAPLAPPSFMQAAERAQRWQTPRWRRAVVGLCALAAALLAFQIVVEYRELIAARWAAMRAPLQALCRVSGCRVEAPRVIDALVVESSGLTRVEGTSTYRLSLVLRNRSALELAMPALDLVLTDSQGRVISRRVLSALELGAPGDTVPAGADFALQATLGVAERPVAGYTIDVFYP